MSLPFSHLTSVSQLTPDINEEIFKDAERMEKIIKEQGRCNELADKVVALLFYEPSTRTMLSFQSAAVRLGAGVLTAHGVENSSFKKGETIEDTIRMACGYADCIVLRHAEEGAAKKAANVCSKALLNAGDGGNEHPTQALLDLYTIRKEYGTLENLHVAFSCDPAHSRTIRSLATALSQYSGNRFTFVSPENLRMSEDLRTILEERGIEYEETTNLQKGVEADVLYMNRLQEERFVDKREFEENKTKFVLTADMLRTSNVKILSPLPRIGEIEQAVDGLPNARYFDQAKNGVPVRMALLKMILEQS